MDLSFFATLLLAHPVLCTVLPMRASCSAYAFFLGGGKGITSYALHFSLIKPVCTSVHSFWPFTLLSTGWFSRKKSDYMSGDIPTTRSTFLGLNSQFPYLVSELVIDWMNSLRALSSFKINGPGSILSQVNMSILSGLLRVRKDLNPWE